MKNIKLALFALTLFALSSCQVVAGIFKAGVAVGIIIVVVIVGIIIWIIAKVMGR
ncbi:MAG TPA: hypothetical protein VHS53_01135 [Mucilaginibacter sp.]|jgi:hypothetical protein|nr:hypothetical protein [Mucilaginibacter sp.]